MRVVALVGESGTGKSYKALSVMNSEKIEYLIDDGILISNNTWIAGKSAKREDSIFTAVKRAVFHFDEHRREVLKAIKDENISSIMIVGTSDKMVEQIARRLELGEIDKIIRIQDISTPLELKMAHHSRNNEGKHVIPLPSVELKKSFSGYMIFKLKGILKKDKQILEGERTIIRPTFSYIGNYTISQKAIIQIIAFTIEGSDHFSFSKCKIDQQNEGITINLDISMRRTVMLMNSVKELQGLILRSVEKTCGLNVLKININITDITFN